MQLITSKNALRAIIFFLGIVLSVRFSLRFVDEPTKIQLWTSLQEAMPFIGSAGILLVLLIWIFTKSENLPLKLIAASLGIGVVTVSFLELKYPSSLSDATHRLSIRVPLDGPVVVAWGGDTVKNNYHAAYPDQRWAYDLVTEPHSGSFSSNAEFGCFGKVVRAPISGIIATAHDGEPDLPPGEATASLNVFGNYIVIKPEDQDETRLVIAHLKEDSILVERDQIVQAGYPIGQCGNSGSSTEPHVHIHFLKILRSGEESFLIGQPLFFNTSNGVIMPIGGFEKVDGKAVAAGAIIKNSDQLDE